MSNLGIIQDAEKFVEAMDPASFSYNDLLGKDRWVSFTPSGSLTIVGTATYTGRLRLVGRKCEFQVQLSASTSVASVAGTSYLTLPIPPNVGSISGMAIMTNNTSNIAVGICHIDVATGRCYLPTQLASNNTFTIFGDFEI